MREEPVEVVVIRAAKKDSAQVIEARRKVMQGCLCNEIVCETEPPGVVRLHLKMAGALRIRLVTRHS